MFWKVKIIQHLLCVLIIMMPVLCFGKTSTKKFKSSAGKVYQINYMSKDFIYLKGGIKSGLASGDTLTIHRKRKLVAVLVVEHASNYSSSCKVILEKGLVVLGDKAKAKPKSLKIEGIKKEEPDTLVSRTRELPEQHIKGDAAKAFARLRGYAAYQLYFEEGLASDKWEVGKQNIRVDFRVSELLNSDYNLRFNMYASQDNNLFSQSEQRQNWDNRVNQFVFGYQNPNSAVSYELGRVVPQNISSIGYIDGGAFKIQANQNQYIGGFFGNIPRMLYYETPISIQKYGGFYGFDFGDRKNTRLENMLGFGGEYDGLVISREFLNLRNNLYLSKNLSISQTSEIEVNRGWRKEKTRKDFSLSSMYAHGNWKATQKLSFGIQYDTRKNYYRLDMRSFADSLFDDATRHGLKANTYYRFLPSSSVYLSVGQTRFQNRGDIPYNYNLGLNVSNFILKRIYVNASYTGFNSETNNGYNTSLFLRKSFLNGNNLSFGYGKYEYKYNSTTVSRIQSNWIRTGTTLQMIYNTYVTVNYEYNWGQVQNGHRGFWETGYRF